MAVLAYSQVGYYFIFRNSQSQQKEAIKEKINSRLAEGELQIISFTDNQQKIYWEEEGKEFLLNGEMYDVVKSKTVNGKELLYCINDKKERELVDKYNSITKHNSSSDKKGKSNVDNSQNLFIFDIDDNRDQFAVSPVNRFGYFDSQLLENVMDHNSPPPKV